MKIINLNGPDGNAFALLGMAKTWSKQLGLDYSDISKRMMSGDYEQLVDVFEETFSDFVELERD